MMAQGLAALMIVRKMRKFTPLMLTLLLIACGALTVEVHTEVMDERHITHDVRMVVSGSIVAEALGQDTAAGAAGLIDKTCTHIANQIDGEDRVEISCMGLSHGDLSAEQKSSFGNIRVTKTDLGDKWEYRATADNILSTFDKDEIERTPAAEGRTIDEIITARYYWTLTMPGEIVQTNTRPGDGNEEADQTNTVKFVGRIGDDRDTFMAVSHQNKPSSTFGACN